MPTIFILLSGVFNAAPRFRHGWSRGEGGLKPLVRAGPESPQAPRWAPDVGGLATDEEKDYQDMICLGRKGGQSLRGEGPWSFFSMGFY